MSTINNPFYRRGFDLVNFITPFTYRDGLTLLQLIAEIRKHIEHVSDELNVALDKFLKEFEDFSDSSQEAFDSFKTEIIALVNSINDRVGPVPVQYIPSSDTVEISPLWPQNQPVKFRVIQDGEPLTFASNITGSVTIPTPIGSVSFFTLIPNGDGTWNVYQPVTRNELAFNIYDFGAVGDGVSDDQPAIQAAIVASAGKGYVFIPAGTYAIGSTIRPIEGTRIDAYGATISRLTTCTGMVSNWPESGDSGPVYTGPSNITLNGGIYNARGDNEAMRQANVLTFEHSSNVIIRDVTVLNTMRFHALELNACNNVLVEHCEFRGFNNILSETIGRKEAIQIDYASEYGNTNIHDNTVTKNVTVQNCSFGPSNELPAHGVFVGAHGWQGTNYYENINVLNCRIDTARAFGIRAMGFRESNFIGNTINGCLLDSVFLENTTFSTVANNTILDSGDRGVRVDYGHNIIVDSNTVVRHRLDGIRFYDVEQSAITNNAVRTSQTYGITVTGADKILYDNSIMNNRLSGEGTNDALGVIRVSGNGRNTSIEGNVIRKATSSDSPQSAVSLGSTTVATWVFGNDFLGMPVAVKVDTGGDDANTTSNRI